MVKASWVVVSAPDVGSLPVLLEHRRRQSWWNPAGGPETFPRCPPNAGSRGGCPSR
ncbi:hypothetical protein QJS66_06525 [Kocuria rhizophila]|nr:hypothetical protein QJS66_06525 [Kocuria rhizophila]